MSLLIALYVQAVAATTPVQTPPPVSDVVIESPNTAKTPPKVYTAPYKAAPHFSSAPVIPPNVDMLSADPRLGPYMVSAVAAQRYRAKKAATLINAGRCPEALQAVFNEGDQYLAFRIAQVCNLPVPMERRGGPF